LESQQSSFFEKRFSIFGLTMQHNQTDSQLQQH